MSVIPFSFDYTDLIGNFSGCTILASINYILKGVNINFKGYTGILNSGLLLLFNNPNPAFNSFTSVIPAPWQTDDVFPFESPFTYYDRNICSLSNVDLQGQYPCTLFYFDNGRAADADPQNVIISGSITI